MKKNAIKIKGNGFRGLDHSWWEYYSNRGLREGFVCSTHFDYRWVNMYDVKLRWPKISFSGKLLGDE